MRARRGSMMMEAVLVLPLLVAMICCVFQLAAMAMGRVMLEYAAYAAARVTMVANKSQRADNVRQAAARVLAPVAGGTKTGLPNETWAKNAVSYPGWGDMPGTASLGSQVRVTVEEKDAGRRYDPARYQCVTVEFDFPLTIPVASALLAVLMPNGRTVDGMYTVCMKTTACAVGWTDDIYPKITR